MDLDELDDLQNLAMLLKAKNQVGKKIVKIIDRPAQIGHIGEYIASKIFDIQLEESATHKGSDGRFRAGPLVGRSVNIKFYGKMENILDIKADALPDYYLVLTGTKAAAVSSKGKDRPWVIEYVFLFDTEKLMEVLRARGVKLGVATSVIKLLWDQAEIYPNQTNSDIELSIEQQDYLRMFCE